MPVRLDHIIQVISKAEAERKQGQGEEIEDTDVVTSQSVKPRTTVRGSKRHELKRAAV